MGGRIADTERRQKILGELNTKQASQGLTVNQISAAVGFDARQLINHMAVENLIVQGKRVFDEQSQRRCITYHIKPPGYDFNEALLNFGRRSHA